MLFRPYACPKLKRPGRPRKNAILKPESHPRLQNGDHSSSSSDSETESDSDEPTDAFGNPLKAISGKPKALIDGLTRFFTPTNSRKSRVSLNSFDDKFATAMLKKKNKSSSQQQNKSKVQQAANRLIKKYKGHNKGRKPTSGPPGSGQLKGLFDGLSHLFTAQGERKRTIPVYASPQRFRKFKLDFEPSVSASKPEESSGVNSLQAGRELKSDFGAQSLSTHIGIGRGRGRGSVLKSQNQLSMVGIKRGPGRPPGGGRGGRGRSKLLGKTAHA